ncbi:MULTISPECIES: pantetheine-phosphate adenylyltransferase [Acetobacter]|uniref:Phosphopantetheine adenylyltransferase n=1 Tax=Acetobacter thailandicus TaxID=1502842 RepID=A0ABT3QGQ2_9PROT|nr:MULTISPECIES: pantetheine-phosphate adenylyltransferase [Acetobacter]MBS0960733.1 pantetheine-phosphate adenylyltransferase [Acetobacter thailandicus]MBS0980842.1 pantetheine-phosphate adenylyltransferase [Acetobacter thailandicus]MBS0985812.1 pantetheine-phosphate adenylyltransferase [Acetobacter thailandicus]MBS1004388.1 pantetheine-phosphate adenylyltransferase [Acetobacter thailandicus]MCX2564458.1 pantetheine-phosphate adenylyltransferase [Acetobacter thailandicus]
MTTTLARRTGFYAGTFDPVTAGHFDVITRAARLVDKLIIGVAENTRKNPLMPLADRLDCMEQVILPVVEQTECDIRVVSFDCLLVDAVKQHGASVIIRGLRALTDFDYEIQMTGVNRRLDSSIETVFLMASERTQFISSSFTKEVARYGGDISHFVTPYTQERLLACLQASKAKQAKDR